MKILFIHNSYSEQTPTGEEHAAHELARLLEEHGHEVRWCTANSDRVRERMFGSFKAFFTGIHNPCSARRLAKLLDDFQPDVVQVQNIYPVISSSIFRPLKKRHIPVVMRCPNYRLFCPTGLCLNPQGKVCEACWHGTARELHCVLKNCEHSHARSLGYAIRNAFNRMTRRIMRGVDMFIVQSEFQCRKFIVQGIPAEKIGIVPGITPEVRVPEDKPLGNWVCFVGRVSAEKGIYEFIEAARQHPDIPFKVAGFRDANFALPYDCPANLEFVGFLKGEALDDFHIKSRIIVVPSKWYEGFPNVILRAFLFERSVISTNIGAMQSIIESGKDGILVAPGNAQALSQAISELYNQPKLCTQYGKAGCEKALTLYSREQIYRYLMEIYQKVLN